MIDGLAEHYSAFRVSERLFLTGHSHQAWPDVAREGQLEAWQDGSVKEVAQEAVREEIARVGREMVELEWRWP